MDDGVAMQLEVDKAPSDQFSLENRTGVHPDTHRSLGGASHVLVEPNFYLTLSPSEKTHVGRIGLSGMQRIWLNVALKSRVSVRPVSVDRRRNLIGEVSVELDFYQKPKKSQGSINTDDLARLFQNNFSSNVFCNDQMFVLGFENMPLLKAKVLKITAEDIDQLTGKSSRSKRRIQYGVLHGGSRVIFEKQPESPIQLIGRFRGDSAHTAIISPDWNFKDMGIGGLDKEFSDIFRRAFASRVFPPDIVEQMGMKHVRGILLFGPPGCGKTLMARQIGKMLNAREPKIINGPEVLNKYVGQSEENIRTLFLEAEQEEKKAGINSALHIIIFDEIDAICRQRGSLSGSTGVHDTVVNQLLAKMDGVEQLNNILVIGMTNRKDMIDEALLRPGRLEVQMEIGLPSEEGRLEILQIHTALMTKHGKLAQEVDLKSMSSRTRNFSGAELEGLVRSAQSTAMNRIIKAKDKVSVSHEDADKMKITGKDFEYALQFDVKPAFGISDKQLDSYVLNGVIPWGSEVSDILERGKMAVQQARESVRTPLVSLLLRGRVGSGKTALAAHIAKESLFPFIKVVTPEDMIGFSESAKCQAIKKVFDDAYKSELSCIVLDDIERMLDYVSIGPRFSNIVLQALLVLLRKIPPNNNKLLIVGTTSLSLGVLEDMGVKDAFGMYVEVPYLESGSAVLQVMKESNLYTLTEKQLANIQQKLKGKRLSVGIKKLLTYVEASFQTEDAMRYLETALRLECGLN